MGQSVQGNELRYAKRQFLVVIDAEVIRRTKILAIDQHVTASSLVLRALQDLLQRDAPIPAAQNA